MQRQKHTPYRRVNLSPEELLGRQGTGHYCEKCQRFVRAKDAVTAGKGRLRCPACGEPLERRRQGGQASASPA